MKLAKLARDPTLVPRSLGSVERSMRGDFITIRVRLLGVASTDPTDIPDTKVAALRTQLATEIAQASARYTDIDHRVNADAAANDKDKLFLLSTIDPRMTRQYYATGIVSDSKSMRSLLVKSIVWQATAVNPELLDSARLDDLHLLVDRRLHIVERMLYDVGWVKYYWDAKEIFTHQSGPWKDGWTRMFEYPRLPQKVGDSDDERNIFQVMCSPDNTAGQICQNPAMTDWQVKGPEHLVLIQGIRLNPKATPLWDFVQGKDEAEFLYKQDPNQPDANQGPVQAIESLFTPSDDYKKRNLLYCDYVIHILHIEALLWAKKKRSADISWLTNYIGGTTNKLRISVPLKDYPAPGFLASTKDGVFFDYVRIHLSQAQIGDHLIVYNHPAYDKATASGAWRLENALVVQVYPKLLFQGHGTPPLTIDQMKAGMIILFNQQLHRLRAQLLLGFAKESGWPSLVIPGFGTKENESQWRDLVNEISRNDRSKKDYPKHYRALRFALENLVVKIPETLDHIQLGGPSWLSRAHHPIGGCAPAQRYADWWLQWNVDENKDEPAIMLSATRSALAWKIHKIHYQQLFNDYGVGNFPLWEPNHVKAGQIARINEVNVSADMVAAWTWFMPEDPAERNKFPVLRPRV